VLIANHHGLQWEDGIVPYNTTKRLITMAVAGTEENDNDNETFVYVKGSQKREWLKDTLENEVRNDMIIDTLDVDYENVGSLKNLDNINTMRCGKHIENCALQNVFKIFNWRSQRQKELQEF